LNKAYICLFDIVVKLITPIFQLNFVYNGKNFGSEVNSAFLLKEIILEKLV